MKRNTLAMAALGLGAAFLMRNKESREKLKGQVNDFTKNGEGEGFLDQAMNSINKKNSTI